jgi:hypothetical protein
MRRAYVTDEMDAWVAKCITMQIALSFSDGIVERQVGMYGRGETFSFSVIG